MLRCGIYIAKKSGNIWFKKPYGFGVYFPGADSIGNFDYSKSFLTFITEVEGCNFNHDYALIMTVTYVVNFLFRPIRFFGFF